MLVGKLFKGVEDGGRDFLEKRMRDEERDKVVEGNRGIDKLGDGSFDDDRRGGVLNGCKGLESLAGDVCLLFESGFGWHDSKAEGSRHRKEGRGSYLK